MSTTYHVIVYREGNNWIANYYGSLHQLPYYLQTKISVKRWLQERHDQLGNPQRLVVKFAD